jgi:hypothetical protein
MGVAKPDLDTLRHWRAVLTNGTATVTVEAAGVRYVIPHATVNIDMTRDVTGEGETLRGLPGYRVKFTGEAEYESNLDAMRRERLHYADA